MIVSQPIPMVQEGMQMCPVKMRIEYLYSSNYVSSTNPKIDVELYGVNKGGSVLIAKCPLTVASGYTGGEYSSSVEIGIPAVEFPFVYFKYEPIIGFKIIGSPELMLEVREYPDVLDTTIYTDAVFE